MRIRSTTAQDLDVFVRTVHTAFGRFPETPDVNGGGLWSAVEMDRTLLAESEGKAVGTATAYSFELTLPDGVVAPAAGISAVGVLPTHRRQGVLTGMMRHQLGELRERGEFLSVLPATEGGTYGRFGYGPATYTRRMTVQRSQGAFRTQVRTGSIEVLPRSETTGIMEEVSDRCDGDVPDGYASYTLDNGSGWLDVPRAAGSPTARSCSTSTTRSSRNATATC